MSTSGTPPYRRRPRRRLIDRCIGAVRIELVIDPEPDNVVRDMGGKRHGDRRRVLTVGADGGIRAEAHVQVFDLAGHVAGEMRLDAAADHKARLCSAAGEIGGCGSGGRIAVGIDAGDGPADGGGMR